MSNTQKEEPKLRLYTFKLQKEYQNEKRVFDYQVPAYNRDEALLKVGQTFCNRDDEYELTLLEG